MSPAQTALFWRVEKTAWERYAKGCGIRTSDTAEHDAWRHEQLSLATEGKIASTKDVRTQRQYEAVMVHFAALAGDDALVEKFTSGPEQRNAWLIRQKLVLLSWQTGLDHTWEYARGIFVQMRLPDTLLDCPAELASNVQIALDTQFRRNCKEADVRPADAVRAHKLGAVWTSRKVDRDYDPLWQRATAAAQEGVLAPA